MYRFNLWLMAEGGAHTLLNVVLALTGASRGLCGPLRGMLRSIERLHRTNGTKWLVAYLKEASIHVIHFVSGRPDATCQSPTWVGLSAGLPKVIPGVLRSEIRRGNVLAIRLVLTLLGIYRVLRYPGTLKLETINGPFAGSLEALPGFQAYLVDFARTLGVETSFKSLPKPKLYLSTSAGPLGGPASFTAIFDAYNLRYGRSGKGIWALHREFIRQTWGFSWVLILVPIYAWLVRFSGIGVSLPDTLQRLSQKEEAAGKIRVFAIVDYWSQVILRPIHKRLFSILRSIEQDGTFDQDRAVRYIRDYMAQNNLSFVASYDLSAATDRVPAVLYQALLLALGYESPGTILAILTFRKWGLDKTSGGHLQYLVGQPMGALGSWGLLALTHHALVQYSASLAGKEGWFPGYAVLGDDVVIADRDVAAEYHALMTGFGIGISLHKSIVSDIGTFEFAKRVITPESELTGIPLRMVLESTHHWANFPSLASWCANHGFVLSPVAVTRAYAQLLGCPWAEWLTRPIKDLPEVVRNVLVTLCMPGYPWWRDFSRLASVSLTSVSEFADVVRRNGYLEIIDEWSLVGWLKQRTADNLAWNVSPVNWTSQLVRAGKELDQLSLDGDKLKVPSRWMIWVSPLGLWSILRWIISLRELAQASVGALKGTIVTWQHGIRPVSTLALLRENFAQAWMESRVPGAMETDEKMVSAFMAVSGQTLGSFTVIAPSARARARLKVTLSQVLKGVNTFQQRLGRASIDQ